MTPRNDASGFWFSRRTLPTELAIALLPWFWFAWLIVWGKYFGPNMQPPWPVGDRALYEWTLYPFTIASCGGVTLFLIVRFAIRRRDLLPTLAAGLSFIAVGLLAPNRAFA